MDCQCAAHSEGECGCPGVDWTPSEVHDLRSMLKEARESLAFRRDLYRRQNKLMREVMDERDGQYRTAQFNHAAAMKLRTQRDEAFRLLRVIEEGHRNVRSRLYYQACDTDPCEWCRQVRPLILPENVVAQIKLSNQNDNSK